MAGRKPCLLVTGANGFIGRALCRELVARGSLVREVVRGRSHHVGDGNEIAQVVAIDENTDWQEALSGGVNAVIHLAARVHVMNDTALDPLTEYRRINVQGTLHLARQAAEPVCAALSSSAQSRSTAKQRMPLTPALSLGGEGEIQR